MGQCYSEDYSHLSVDRDELTVRIIPEKYELDSLMVQGGTGKVMSGHSSTTKKRVAVKLIPANSLHAHALFKNEVNALSTLKHPNIVHLEGGYRTSTNYHIATTYLDGGDLFDKVAASTDPIKESDAAVWIYGVLSALVHCHERNIVHRDIKPENVVFHSETKSLSPVSLIDFGCSLLVKDSSICTAALGGTIFYTAPELTFALTNKQVFPTGAMLKKSDVWAVGILAFWVLTRCVPFSGNDNMEICRRIQSDPVRYPAGLVLSDLFKDFIEFVLHKKISGRPSAKKALEHPWVQTCVEKIVENGDEESEWGP